jgi:RNA polymerase sigma factor (sigma-70 family)
VTHDPGDLLERLGSPQPGPAWNEFLERYTPVMMSIVRRYESDPGRVMDCFLHACGELSSHGFKRLRRYQPGGKARFPTWLSAVVANLCVDWRRMHVGRFRLSKAVSRLPELEQLVYRYIYVRGMPRDECLFALQARYPELSEQELARINARLFRLLTSRQRWQLSLKTAETLQIAGVSAPADDEPTLQIEDPAPGPDVLSERTQDHARLERALAKLPANQRLLLKMRYQQDLTLDEVARLMRLGDPFRANRQILAAVAALAELMKG